MPKTKPITVQDVLDWNPCGRYSKKLIEKLFAGRESITAIDICDMDIPALDKLWAVLRDQVIEVNDLHEIACRFAESTLINYESKYPDDKRPRLAIEAKRKWLQGEISDEELDAAESAARSAAQSAAESAARSAAWSARSAARSAAQSAAESAAESAARSAAESAAQSAARSAAQSAQVGIIKNYLTEVPDATKTKT